MLFIVTGKEKKLGKKYCFDKRETLIIDNVGTFLLIIYMIQNKTKPRVESRCPKVAFDYFRTGADCGNYK